MNLNHRTIGTGIAAAIVATISIGAGLDAAAANRPSPDVNKRPAPAVAAVDDYRPCPDANKRPKPSVVTMPCPAADDVPQCELTVTAPVPTTIDGSLTALRSPATAGGGAVILNVGRVTPSLR